MRKTLFASSLILLLAFGLVWSASAAATGVQADAEQVLKQYDSAHGAVEADKPPSPSPSSPCTVSCWPDPFDPGAPLITCSSQTGNCSTGGGKGLTWIICDGQRYICPYL